MGNDWQLELDEAVSARFGQMVEVRRHLHQYPEVSQQEHQTSLYLYQLCSGEGFDVRMGPEGRGVVVDSRPAVTGAVDDGPHRIAVRADIDALRIQDQKDVPYRSKRPGVMHACGHDCHTAIALGAILGIRDTIQSGRLPWPVHFRGIFQPAEETCTGAREMIEAGALDDVAAIIAVHMDPSRSVGRIGVRPGVLTASCDTMHIRIVGRGGHAARPHEAQDPIAAAAQLISALYLFIPRKTDSLDAVVVTVGQVLGGDNPNVIPEEVQLHGTMRTLDRRVRQQTIEHIRRLADGVSQTSDTRIEVEFELGAESVRNDAGLTALMEQAGRAILGPAGIEVIPRPSMGAEDFAYYLDHVPGAMIRIGGASEVAGGAGLHTPQFDVDERSLLLAARILARSAVQWADPQPSAARADAASLPGDASANP